MDASFKINDVIYPIPTRFRTGDTVLVKELTGLEFEDFAERIDDLREAFERGEEPSDMLATIGLIGVAVWQSNERWTRDKARRFVENIDIQAVTAEGGDVGPPASGAEETASPLPDASNESIITPAVSPEPVQS